MPKFKVGDIIKSKFSNEQYKITQSNNTSYEIKSISSKTLYIYSISDTELYHSLVNTTKLMFQIGDTLLDVQGLEYKVFDYDYIHDQYGLIDQSSTKNYYVKATVESVFKLKINNIAPILPIGTKMIGNPAKFNIRDIVITKWGNELAITAVDHLLEEYFYRIIRSNNPTKIGTTDKETFAIANSNWKLKDMAQTIKSVNHVCKCDSKDLFNKGCKCGAVKTFKSKWY